MTLALWLVAVMFVGTAALALLRASSVHPARQSASAIPALTAVVLAGATLTLAAAVSLGETGVSIVLAVVQELARAVLAPLFLRQRDERGPGGT